MNQNSQIHSPQQLPFGSSQVFQTNPGASGFYSSTIRPIGGSSHMVQSNQFQQFHDEDEESKQVQSDRRWINLCILVLPFILAILFFISGLSLLNAAQSTKLNLDGADNVLDFVHDNLQANPISSIVSTFGECPVNYDDMRLGKWYGIDRGCLCKNGSTFAKESAEDCLPYLNDGCEFETGENSQNFYRWTDPELSFCARYTPGHQWVKTADCDLSKNTYCGSSVCILGKGATCPPNLLKIQQISSSAGDKSSFLIKPEDEKKTKSAIFGTLEYQQNSDPIKNTAIVSFTISQGKKVCLNKKYAQTDNNIYNLDVQQSYNSVCDEFGALNENSVVFIDQASQREIFNSNDLASVYTSQNLVFYDPKDYTANTYNLLGVKKIAVQKKAACNIVYDDHMEDAADISSTTRTVLSVFAWILFLFSIVTVILGIVFLLGAVSKILSNQQSTRVKLARIYWYSAWILVGLSVLIFLFYHIFVSIWLNNSEQKLAQIKDQNCFSGNEGINLAITKLINYDEETRNSFQHLVNLIFIYGIVYSGIWIAVIAFFKGRYNEVSSFFGK